DSESAEARAAVWSSSIGVMGASVEVVGVGIQLLRPDVTVTVRASGGTKTVMLGTRVAQYGGAIAAVSGLMDGFQYVFAAIRASDDGDAKSKTRYRAAAGAAFGSAAAGFAAAFATRLTILGPTGIAIALGLLAYIWVMQAKKARSSSLELWARHSLWGSPSKHRRWTAASDFDTAVGALNAAVLGMSAEIKVQTERFRKGDASFPTDGRTERRRRIWIGKYIIYHISLPGYEESSSRYSWTLTVYRPGDSQGQIIVSGESGKPSTETPSPPSIKNSDYFLNTTVPTVFSDEKTKTLVIQGAIALHTIHSVHAVKLEARFWPDKNDRSGFARLLSQEDKTDSRGWNN
ncbi:hypothetical protein N7373_26000, partial [Achromobacter mucicolens]|uniref:hypothetical protein n=1 Tax=Achromobacter mucicolens TaxID=1389922 RepID=UPI0024474A1D